MHTTDLNEYTDWFLTQLLIRQFSFSNHGLKEHLYKLSYKAFTAYGSDIFYE
jgi:hypothetical protein